MQTEQVIERWKRQGMRRKRRKQRRRKMRGKNNLKEAAEERTEGEGKGSVCDVGLPFGIKYCL